MAKLRRVLRWGHLTGGLYLGIFLFSPLRSDPTALFIARVMSLMLLVSGLCMWQLPRLLNLRGRSANGGAGE